MYNIFGNIRILHKTHRMKTQWFEELLKRIFKL